MQADGRLQRWNSKGLQQGLVEAAARDSENAETAEGYVQANGRLQRQRAMQANGRLQRWNSKGLQQGLVEAAARDSEHFKCFKGFKHLKAGKRQAWTP